MTDRELLEAAARAAGVARSRWDYDYCRNLGHMVTQSMMWNPLADNCARYRLIKKLKMGIDFDAQSVIYTLDKCTCEESFKDDGDDARAVLRAAAEIGRNM